MVINAFQLIIIFLSQRTRIHTHIYEILCRLIESTHNNVKFGKEPKNSGIGPSKLLLCKSLQPRGKKHAQH